ncbi:hypothetical protein K438DRAFT_2015608 [Mycena galopus ATCC 62051]|nr:hypothetical protein K438DRAFT_2015608 [Mycena galopus ATCC 62051]
MIQDNYEAKHERLVVIPGYAKAAMSRMSVTSLLSDDHLVPRSFSFRPPHSLFSLPAADHRDVRPRASSPRGSRLLVAPRVRAAEPLALPHTHELGIQSITGLIPQPKGSDPRQIRVSHSQLYILRELTSTLRPAHPGRSQRQIPYHRVPVIVSANPPGALWAAAEILIPPPSLAGTSTSPTATRRVEWSR